MPKGKLAVDPRCPEIDLHGGHRNEPAPVVFLSLGTRGPIGFRINMLRSATGRSYLAFCGEDERQAILQRLASSSDPGDLLARKPSAVKKILEETRERGYGTRAVDFGGHYEKVRRDFDDRRDSIAVPIWAGNEVVAAVNLTWIHKVVTVQHIVKTCLPHLAKATREISVKLESA